MELQKARLVALHEVLEHNTIFPKAQTSECNLCLGFHDTRSITDEYSKNMCVFTINKTIPKCTFRNRVINELFHV